MQCYIKYQSPASSHFIYRCNVTGMRSLYTMTGWWYPHPPFGLIEMDATLMCSSTGRMISSATDRSIIMSAESNEESGRIIQCFDIIVGDERACNGAMHRHWINSRGRPGKQHEASLTGPPCMSLANDLFCLVKLGRAKFPSFVPSNPTPIKIDFFRSLID